MWRALWMIAALSLAAQPCTAQTAADRALVASLPDKFSQAWAAHDAKALSRIMSPDVDFVNVGAIWLRGEDFGAYHDRVLKGRFRMSTNVPLARDVKFLRPDLALVRWSWRVEGELAADGAPLPPRHGLMLMLAQKRRDVWLVTDAQNTNAGPSRPEAADLKGPIVVPRNP